MKTSWLADVKMFRLGFAAAAVMALSACVVAPTGYRPIAAGTGQVVGTTETYVTVAPPAPYVEVIPQRMFADQIWLPGYWAWQGGRHHWMAGRWQAPPRGHSNWVGNRWIQEPGRGWRFEHGRWR